MKSEKPTHNATCFKAVINTDNIPVCQLKKQMLKQAYHEERIVSKEAVNVATFRCPLPTNTASAGLLVSLTLPFVWYDDVTSLLEAFDLLGWSKSPSVKNAVDTMKVQWEVRKALKNLDRENEAHHREVMKFHDLCVDPLKENDLHYSEKCYHTPSWRTLGPDFAPIDESNPLAFLYGVFESDTYKHFRVCLLPGPVEGSAPVGRFVFYIPNEPCPEAYVGTWTVVCENEKPVVSWKEVSGVFEGTFTLDWNVEKEAFDLCHNSDEILYRRTECLVDVSVDVPQISWAEASSSTLMNKMLQQFDTRDKYVVYFNKNEQKLKYICEKKPRSEKPSYAARPLVTPREHNQPRSQSSQFWSLYRQNDIQEQKEFRKQKFSKKMSKRGSGGRQDRRSMKRPTNKRENSKRFRNLRGNSRTKRQRKNGTRRRHQSQRSYHESNSYSLEQRYVT